jgi:8-oxo-dGTP pyrophosphatase MutT (NUDIX family)
MKRFASVILIAEDGRVLLQRRDNNAEIKDPGMLSIFAGAALHGEAPEQTALREIEEEATLSLTPNDVTFVGEATYNGHHSMVFVAHAIEPSSITIREGAGVEAIALRSLHERTDIAPISKIALELYVQSFNNA